mmetsp:Transcript_54471/g.62427  ORF Transcript_54471/g.62427 Transcript_54471/m.62427 type:complete len:115 (-) Transcript_54471:1936-2280(-)
MRFFGSSLTTTAIATFTTFHTLTTASEKITTKEFATSAKLIETAATKFNRIYRTLLTLRAAFEANFQTICTCLDTLLSKIRVLATRIYASFRCTTTKIYQKLGEMFATVGTGTV